MLGHAPSDLQPEQESGFARYEIHKNTGFFTGNRMHENLHIEVFLQHFMTEQGGPSFKLFREISFGETTFGGGECIGILREPFIPLGPGSFHCSILGLGLMGSMRLDEEIVIKSNIKCVSTPRASSVSACNMYEAVSKMTLRAFLLGEDGTGCSTTMEEQRKVYQLHG